MEGKERDRSGWRNANPLMHVCGMQEEGERESDKAMLAWLDEVSRFHFESERH